MLQKRIMEFIDLNQMNCSYFVKNLKTGEVVFYQENRVVPSASLIKIFVMAEVLRQVQSGKLTLRQRMVVHEENKVPSSILSMLETGNDYSLNDLVTLMIVQSDNTAANILIDTAGPAEISELIRSLKFKDTVLRRRMMDWNARKAGLENVTTAAEIARVLELLYRGELIDQKNSIYMIELMKKQLDNSMMRLFIPDETVIAHKTGELDFLCHEAGIIYHEKADILFVAMVWDAVSNNYARYVIGRMAEIVYHYFMGC